MADFISREAAYKTLTECYHHSYGVQHAALREALNRVPTADVRPVVRGKWGVDKSGYPMIVCSECGVKIPVIAGWCMDAHINFCPNCGADMRPEQPEEETHD